MEIALVSKMTGLDIETVTLSNEHKPNR